MKQVTKEEFFQFIGPLDVNPSHVNPEIVEWKTRYGNGQIVGLSVPSWKNYYTNGQPTKPEYWIIK
jgi:hypothetical protein